MPHPNWRAEYSLASHADVLRGLITHSCPTNVCWLERKKRRPITADFQIWEVHFGPWEISHLTLWLQKRSERSHERWRSYSFRTNYSVNSQAFELVPTLTESCWKKLPRRLNLLNGNRLYYKTITCEKNSAFCSVSQGNPAITSPKEQLYEQMTSYPASLYREKCTKTQRLSPMFSSGAKIFGHVSHSTELVRMCLACQQLTSTAPIGSPIIWMWSPADICEQWERNLSLSSADIRGAGTCDEP